MMRENESDVDQKHQITENQEEEDAADDELMSKGWKLRHTHRPASSHPGAAGRDRQHGGEKLSRNRQNLGQSTAELWIKLIFIILHQIWDFMVL